MTAPAGGARPGAGRPRLNAEAQAVRLNIRIPRSLAEWLDTRITTLERPSGGRSAVVRVILENARLEDYFPNRLNNSDDLNKM